MDSDRIVSLVLICILVAYCNANVFFDVDELQAINYGIDILNEPVVMSTEETLQSNSVYLTSKYGQQYQCNFPNQVEQEKQKEEQEKIAMEIGIPDLLKPLETGQCLKKTKDWWSYEFCYGKYIRQYHLGEDGRIQGEILFLGYYGSEFDWDDETNQDLKKKNKNRLTRYHTQQYVNGSKCELTDKLRRTEVRFICEEGSGDYIRRLDEPETCVYVMTIHTTRICHHPYLKSPTPHKTVPITCNPLLSVAQYQDYLDLLQAEEEAKQLREQQKLKEAEEKHLQEEEKKKYFKDSNSESGGEEDEDGAVSQEEEDEGTSVLGDRPPQQLEDELSNIMKAVQAANGKQDPGEMKMVIKMVQTQEDMEKLIKEMSEEMQQETEKINKMEVEAPESGDMPLKFSTKEETEKSEDEDKEIMDGFESELKSIKDRYRDKRERLMAMKERVKGDMEDQFDDILKEAQEEIDDDSSLEPTDKRKAFETLSTTLNKLIGKLEKTEKEISEVDQQLGKFASYDHKEPEAQQTGEATQEGSQDLVKGPEKPEKADGRVKVRVTRVKSGQSTKEGQEISSKQTEQLERTVEKELEEAGLGDQGGKIHVKIITSAYLDDKDESVHVLSEEESETFRSMIVSIMGGQSEGTREEVKHHKMEDNYSFVWGKDKPTSSSSSSSADSGADSTTEGTSSTEADGET